MSTPPVSDEALRATHEAWLEAGKDYTKAGKKLGLGDKAVKNRVQQAIQRGLVATPAPTASKGAAGKSLEDFRAAHDKSYIVPGKVRAALKALGDGWEYEMAFAKLAGVSLGDLSAFRAMFEDHIVVVERTKRAWAGSKALAAKMREMTR